MMSLLTVVIGGDPETTNNIMELTGAIKGLEAVKNLNLPDYELIELVSDSTVTLGLASGAYTPSKNVELANRLRDLTTQLKVRTRWVKGHDLNVYNERCDSLAKRGKQEAIECTKNQPQEGCS